MLEKARTFQSVRCSTKTTQIACFCVGFSLPPCEIFLHSGWPVWEIKDEWSICSQFYVGRLLWDLNSFYLLMQWRWTIMQWQIDVCLCSYWNNTTSTKSFVFTFLRSFRVLRFSVVFSKRNATVLDSLPNLEEKCFLSQWAEQTEFIIRRSVKDHRRCQNVVSAKSFARSAGECATNVLRTFWRLLWSVTKQTYGNKDIYMFHKIKKKNIVIGDVIYASVLQ